MEESGRWGITGEQRLQIEASEVKKIQLLLCIQTHALDPFHEQVSCAKDLDYYASHTRCSCFHQWSKDAAGVPMP